MLLRTVTEIVLVEVSLNVPQVQPLWCPCVVICTLITDYCINYSCMLPLIFCSLLGWGGTG